MNGYMVSMQRDRENIRQPHYVGPFLDRESAKDYIMKTSKEPFWRDAQFQLAYVKDWETILEGMVGKGW